MRSEFDWSFAVEGVCSVLDLRNTWPIRLLTQITLQPLMMTSTLVSCSSNKNLEGISTMIVDCSATEELPRGRQKNTCAASISGSSFPTTRRLLYLDPCSGIMHNTTLLAPSRGNQSGEFFYKSDLLHSATKESEEYEGRNQPHGPSPHRRRV